MKQTFRTLSGNVTFNTDGLLNESGMPSYAGGSLTSDDTELRNKPTSGSFGTSDNSKENDDGFQSSYKKSVSKNPIDLNQANDIDGNLHMSGEMWDTSNQNIESQNVKQMLKLLRDKGVLENMPENIQDELQSAYDYQLSQMTKKDKWVCMNLVVNNLAKDPNFYNDLEQFGVGNNDEENASYPEGDDYQTDVDNTEENDVKTWWPNYEPIGKKPEGEEELEEGSIMGDPQDPINKKHMFFKNGRWAVKTEGTDSSDYTDPTAQHDGVMKAVNVEEKEDFSDDEEKMLSKKQTSNKETELKYLNNTILGPDGKPLTWVDDRDIEEDVQFDEKLIKRFRKNANIGENTDWENYKKSIANAQSHEERQAIMKAYIAKSGPMGSSHTDIYKKQKDEPEKFKSKFHGMTPDAVAKYRAEHPKEEPPTESPEKVDEMWAIPSNDSVEVRNGWPLRRKKSGKSSDEQKASNVVEDLDEIVRRIGVFNEMIESGCGTSIINDSLIKELDKEYEQIKMFESIDDMDEGTFICGWCKKTINNDRPDLGVDVVSHGICPSCEDKFNKQLPPENRPKTDEPAAVTSNEPSVDETAKKYPSYSTSNKIHPYAGVEKISADRQTLRDLIPITKKLNVNVEEEPSSDVPIKHIKPETPEIDELDENDSFAKIRKTLKLSKSLSSPRNETFLKKNEIIDQPDEVQNSEFGAGFPPISEDKIKTWNLDDPINWGVGAKPEDDPEPSKKNINYIKPPKAPEHDPDEFEMRRYMSQKMRDATDDQGNLKEINEDENIEDVDAVHYMYFKPTPSNPSGTHFYNMTKDFPEHDLVKGSTVSQRRLDQHGLKYKQPPPTESPEKVDESSDTDIIKYINKKADSGEAEKLIRGTNVESEPSQPEAVPPKLDFKDSRKKSKFRGIIKPDKIDEEESIKQRSDYWKRNKRIDSRNGYGNLGRDEIGQDSHVMDKLSEVKNAIKGMSKEKALEVLGSLKFKNEVRTAVLELKRKRLAKEGFEGAPGGFGQQNVQGSFAQTPNYGSVTSEPFGDSESPNVERSGSLDGDRDRMDNAPIGDEEPNLDEEIYPKNESGEMNTNGTGRAGSTVLGRIITGTGFDKRNLKENIKSILKQPFMINLIKEMKESKGTKKEILKARITIEIKNRL